MSEAGVGLHVKRMSYLIQIVYGSGRREFEETCKRCTVDKEEYRRMTRMLWEVPELTETTEPMMVSVPHELLVEPTARARAVHSHQSPDARRPRRAANQLPQCERPAYRQCGANHH